MNIGFSALWALCTLVALRRARAVAVGRSGWGRLVPAFAAAVGAAAPFALVPVTGVRIAGGYAALSAR